MKVGFLTVGWITVLLIKKGETTAPVVFSPGYGGSDLYLTFVDEDAVPDDCITLNLPIGRKFLAIPSGKGIVLNDKCLQALFSVPTPPGIDISVEFFGTFKGISSPYWQMAKTFEKWGLTEGKTYFGAPFDYRFMAPQTISAYTTSLKSLIEQAFTENGDSKVVLMGHSNGPPTQYSFLQSMTDEWKQKFVGAFYLACFLLLL